MAKLLIIFETRKETDKKIEAEKRTTHANIKEKELTPAFNWQIIVYNRKNNHNFPNFQISSDN